MKILVHVCCGPCSYAVLEKLLEQGQEIVAFFHNPNIQPLAEYIRRREGAEQVARYFSVPIIFSDTFDDESIKCGDSFLDNLPASVSPVSWMRAMHKKEGARCEACWELRLEKTAKYANEHGFDAMTSSLFYSKYQNHEKLREIGERLAIKNHCAFYYEDYRIMWQHGIKRSKELNIYRQPYCGCMYSEYARYSKTLKKMIQINVGASEQASNKTL